MFLWSIPTICFILYLFVVAGLCLLSSTPLSCITQPRSILYTLYFIVTRNSLFSLFFLYACILVAIVLSLLVTHPRLVFVLFRFLDHLVMFNFLSMDRVVHIYSRLHLQGDYEHGIVFISSEWHVVWPSETLLLRGGRRDICATDAHTGNG